MTHVIGDVHGCAETLREMLRVLEVAPGDVVVFVGDYVDRGPDSYDVIEQLIAYDRRLATSGARAVFLKGNQEQMMLDALDDRGYVDGSLNLWKSNGGKETIDSYVRRGLGVAVPSHMTFLNGLETYYENDTHFVVHAGIDPELTIGQNKLSPNSDNVFLWTRVMRGSSKWDKTVVSGHTPDTKVHFRPNRVLLDTGCVFPHEFGWLSAVTLETRKVTSVRYREPGGHTMKG